MVLWSSCAGAVVSFGPIPTRAVWKGHVAAAFRTPDLICPGGGLLTVAGLWLHPATMVSVSLWFFSSGHEARIPAHRWGRLPPVAFIGSLPDGTARGARARRCLSGGESSWPTFCCPSLRGASLSQPTQRPRFWHPQLGFWVPGIDAGHRSWPSRPGPSGVKSVHGLAGSNGWCPRRRRWPQLFSSS